MTPATRAKRLRMAKLRRGFICEASLSSGKRCVNFATHFVGDWDLFTCGIHAPAYTEAIAFGKARR